MVPSSRFASRLKPNVAYRELHLAALWKKQTTVPPLAYAGMPYRSRRSSGFSKLLDVSIAGDDQSLPIPQRPHGPRSSPNQTPRSSSPGRQRCISHSPDAICCAVIVRVGTPGRE
jgi:hypothetical protein